MTGFTMLIFPIGYSVGINHPHYGLFFIHIYLHGKGIIFKTFVFLGVYSSIWTLLYSLDIAVLQFFLNHSTTILNSHFKADAIMITNLIKENLT